MSDENLAGMPLLLVLLAGLIYLMGWFNVFCIVIPVSAATVGVCFGLLALGDWLVDR